MKQFAFILGISLFFSSCTDRNITDAADTSSSGSRKVTFAFSKADGNEFEVITKATGTMVPNDYTVMFYLFKRADDSDTRPSIKFELVQKAKVTTPLYTIENLDEMGVYKYVFIAVSQTYESLLDAMDFASSHFDADYWTIDLPTQQATPERKSLLDNCYLEFFNYIYDFGDGSGSTKETINIKRDLEIFGDGSTLTPGMEFTTPVNVLMQRQVGVVEFRYPDAQPGDILTCSFSSDYYRVYLSQMVKDEKSHEYTSDNGAVFPDSTRFANNDAVPFPAGDYYSASYLFKNNQKGLPTITQTTTLNGTQNSVKIYVPYTTAKTVGANVDNIYKANYRRADLTILSEPDNPIAGPEGDIRLEVQKAAGGTASYILANTPFPIYRNARTVFVATASGQLIIRFGTAGDDGGINIKDDIWDGDK